MRPSALVGLALLLGAVTAYLTAKWVGLGEQASDRPHIKVVVASTPIEAGTVIANTQIKAIDWLNPDLPPQAVQDARQAIGRVTRHPLQPGEPILENKLAPVDAKAGLSAVITEGKRAISVRVNEVIGVAGFALPGNFVDVLVSGRDDAQQAFSRVVITRAKVLATAQDTTADPNKPKVTNAVTLELTPQEAERLDLARTIGTLSLVLRNEADPTAWSSSGARMPDILGAGANRSAMPPALTLPPTAPDGPPAEPPAGNGRPAAGRASRTERVAGPSVVQEIRGTVRNEVRP